LHLSPYIVTLGTVSIALLLAKGVPPMLAAIGGDCGQFGLRAFNPKSEAKELVLLLLLVLENANVSPSGRWNKMITEESDRFFAGQAR
jgi:hypothetical protein